MDSTTALIAAHRAQPSAFLLRSLLPHLVGPLGFRVDDDLRVTLIHHVVQRSDFDFTEIAPHIERVKSVLDISLTLDLYLSPMVLWARDTYCSKPEIDKQYSLRFESPCVDHWVIRVDPSFDGCDVHINLTWEIPHGKTIQFIGYDRTNSESIADHVFPPDAVVIGV